MQELQVLRTLLGRWIMFRLSIAVAFAASICVLGCSNSESSTPSVPRVTIESTHADLESSISSLRTKVDELKDRIDDFSDGYTDWKDIVGDLDGLMSEVDDELSSVESDASALTGELDPVLNPEPPDYDY